MAKTFFLGLSGVATAGKDTFFKILKSLVEDDNLSVVRVSLADQLKEEIKDFSIKEFNIDPTNCEKDEKELIRPLLVEFGKMKRKATNGRYWIEKLNCKIQNISTSKKTLFVITDIRFCSYDKDEVHWIKEEKKGDLVHISQYTKVPLCQYAKKPSDIRSMKIYKRPANEEEEKNDPLVKENAKYKIEWPRVECSDQKQFDNLKEHVNQFINILKKDNPHFF